MNALMKIDKFLEESDLLIKGVSETVENEVKKQKKKRIFRYADCYIG